MSDPEEIYSTIYQETSRIRNTMFYQETLAIINTNIYHETADIIGTMIFITIYCYFTFSMNQSLNLYAK